MVTIHPEASVVYRYFDARENLLYVGVTLQATKRRWEQHKQRSAWHIFVHRTTVQVFEDSQDAYTAEVQAITTERPIFNRVHNRSKEAHGRLASYLAEVGRLDLLPALAVRLGRRQLDSMDDLLVKRMDREAGGNRSAMTRRLLAYALEHMPIGWQPAGLPEHRYFGHDHALTRS